MKESYKINDLVRVYDKDDRSYISGTVQRVDNSIVTIKIESSNGIINPDIFHFDDDEDVELKFDDNSERFYWAVNIGKLRE